MYGLPNRDDTYSGDLYLGMAWVKSRYSRYNLIVSRRIGRRGGGEKLGAVLDYWLLY